MTVENMSNWRNFAAYNFSFLLSEFGGFMIVEVNNGGLLPEVGRHSGNGSKIRKMFCHGYLVIYYVRDLKKENM